MGGGGWGCFAGSPEIAFLVLMSSEMSIHEKNPSDFQSRDSGYTNVLRQSNLHRYL